VLHVALGVRKDEVKDALLSAACYRHTLTLDAAGLPAVREHHYARDYE
jgi:hypothetical protein